MAAHADIHSNSTETPMFIYRSFSIIPLCIGLLLISFGCDSTDSGSAEPEITGTMQVEGGRGTEVDIVLNLSSESGIQSLKVSMNGELVETLPIDTGALEQTFTYSFLIPPESTVGTSYALQFTLEDQDGIETDIDALVTTGKLIEPPVTYEFDREGASSVAYPGQEDRLDQLEEIKAYLLTGDAGEVLSEQALRDMFANTGGNGGGNFTFVSDRQLESKTFAPDLDNQLFENLFAQAAVASQGGGTASNGTAGLIVRESKGTTILVDESGREFTQLIEKGLMGAVFYNQIYNTYLSDNRIGDGVENVILSEGKNYTTKEHHMDEAFGYWDPPVDFSSNWPAERASEDRFWSHYSNTVDWLIGSNSTIMNAFIGARTAIVNNDPTELTAQRDALYENLDLVAAAVAIHYINDTLEYLSEGSTGDALHVLSEAWAFTNALRYNPRRVLSLEQIEEIMESNFGVDGNFWNVTPQGLNKAKSTLVSAYPQLASVQNDL